MLPPSPSSSQPKDEVIYPGLRRKPLAEMKGRIQVLKTCKAVLTHKTQPSQSATGSLFPPVFMPEPYGSPFHAGESILLSAKGSTAVKELTDPG